MNAPISNAQPHFLVNTPHEVVINLPAGKPCTIMPCHSIINDTRPRIKQRAQGLRDCWYYAMNRIRNRYGKIPVADYQKDREIEKTLSAHQKSIKTIRVFFTEMRRMADQIEEQSLSVNEFVKFSSMMSVSTNPGMREFFEMAHPIFDHFLAQKQEPDLKKYVEFRLRVSEREALKVLFSSFGIDPEREHEEFLKVHTWPTEKWEKLSFAQERNMMSNIAVQIAYKKYGLAESTWHPSQPIQSLKAEIEKRGPLVVMGKFGRGYYQDAPFKLTYKIGEKSVYGWKPGSLASAKKDSHSVVVIGVKCDKDHTGVIYFVDPVDPSDPADQETPRIYAISYNRLLANICNLWAEQMTVMNGTKEEPHFPHLVKYALYNPINNNPQDFS